MQSTAELLKAISALLWPCLAAALLLALRRPLLGLLQTAHSRKFTIKIGGQELTMEEASAQQGNLIIDIQSKILELEKRIGPQAAPATIVAKPSSPLTTSRALLWVDDNPKNNSYLVEVFTRQGLRIDTVSSTAEALDRLAHSRYAMVISDMGRTEAGQDRPTAGLELLRALKARASEIPLVFYCSSHAVREHRDEAMALGALAITSSGPELLAAVDRVRRSLSTD
jgi:CheY-like chemotaxis protein